MKKSCKKVKLRSYKIGSIILCEGENTLLKMERKLSSLGYETEPVLSEGVSGLRIVAIKQVQTEGREHEKNCKKIKLRSYEIGSTLLCDGEIALLKMERKLSSLGYETEPVLSEGVLGLRIVSQKQVQE